MKYLGSILFFFTCPLIIEAKEFGRIGISSYYSDESFKRNSNNSSNNDFLSLGSRFYYRRDQMTKFDQDFQTDLRSLYDFYGKMNKEKQELYDEYTYQIRQFALTRDREAKQGWSIGRFFNQGPDIETLDGLEYERKLDSEFSIGLGGGLAPEINGEDNFVFDMKSKRGLVFFQYRPWSSVLGRGGNNQLSVGFKEYDNQTDSLRVVQSNTFHFDGGDHYLTHQLSYQNVPRGYIDMWEIFYHKSAFDHLEFEGRISTHEQDRIFRSKSERKYLMGNRINEIDLKFDFIFDQGVFAGIQSIYENRGADNGYANGHELHFGGPYLFKSRFIPKFTLGFDNDYDRKDYYGSLALIWSSSTLDVFINEKITEEHYDNGDLLRPILSELGVTYLGLNDFFPTFSFQHSTNANVEIFQVLASCSLTFGENRRPPLPQSLSREKAKE